jgi:type IV secretory pathway VirD2 relaxase
MAPLSAHIAYLKREGVTRDGSPTRMFDAEWRPRRRSRLRRSVQGRPASFPHHRIARGCGELTDLREYTRDLVRQMEADLGTRLDWVAVDHWNTDNPHVHLLVRGQTDQGADLVISRDYISHNLRSRAEELAFAELGRNPSMKSARARPRGNGRTLDPARRRDRPRCRRAGRHRPAPERPGPTIRGSAA